MASIITPANLITDPAADGAIAPLSFTSHECAYCGSAMAVGEPWVREKIYEPFPCNAPRYRRYHADLFAGEEISCWEKHEMERDLARTAARAA